MTTLEKPRSFLDLVAAHREANRRSVLDAGRRGGRAMSIKVASLDCWHANELIYQADGRLDDGRFCYVHYRGGRFSVWVGDVPFAECGQYEGEWIFHADPRGPVSPSTITRGVLDSWSEGRIEWPDRIDGYHNEPEGPPCQSPIRVGEGRV